MKYAYFIPLLAAVLAGNSFAETRIYRCGNTYTNNAAEAQSKGCKLVESGFVTVVEGTRVQGSAGNGKSNTSAAVPAKVAVAAPSSAGTRVDSADQKARDSDARLILESELKKSEARQAELLKEYNNGEPEKIGPEHRNYQKYLDRVAELKANITRNENDIAGIKRELGRVSASK